MVGSNVTHANVKQCIRKNNAQNRLKLVQLLHESF